MKLRTSVVVLVAASGFAPLLTSCSSSDDSALSTTTTEATTTTSVRNFEVATPEGQVSLSLDGELPPGWPTDFQTPDGAEAAGSGSLGGASSTVRVGVFTVDGDGQEVLDFYADDPDRSTTNRSLAGSGDSFLGSVDLVEPDEGSITVLSRGGTTYLIVSLSETAATSTTTTTG